MDPRQVLILQRRILPTCHTGTHGGFSSGDRPGPQGAPGVAATAPAAVIVNNAHRTVLYWEAKIVKQQITIRMVRKIHHIDLAFQVITL
jgi:hypothetical protein